MSAEWKGKVEIEGAQKAASDLDRVGASAASSAKSFKSAAAAAGGVMTVFHGMKAVAQGDASALISVASGASLAWRALSNLHPALRIITIVGTVLVAIWPKIAQHFQTAAQRAEKFRKAMQEAGLAVSAYVRAQESAAKINATLDRQAKAAQQATTAWKNLADATAQYNSAQRSLESVNIDVQREQDIERAGDDPVAVAAAQHRSDLAKAGLAFDAATEQTRRERDEATRSVGDLETQAGAATTKLGAARGARRAAETDFGKALWAATPLADAGDIAVMTKMATAGNRDAFMATARNLGADETTVSPEKLKALAAAYDALQGAVRDEETALGEAHLASETLMDARETLAVKTKAAAVAEDAATAQRSASVQLADINLRKAQRAAEKDLETAEKEAADYKEQQRFGALTPDEQRAELDASIAQKQRDLEVMSGSDPSAKAKATRELTELRRRRDAIKPDDAQGADGKSGRPGEGIDDYISATMKTGSNLAMSRGARRFRSILAASFADKMSPSQFAGGRGATDKPQTAEERLAALQGTANGYLASIAANVQNLGMKE